MLKKHRFLHLIIYIINVVVVRFARIGPLYYLTQLIFIPAYIIGNIARIILIGSIF